MIANKYLILGGVKSGKSRRAELLATELSVGDPTAVYYIATAQALDEEMAQRIKHHQNSRSSQWQTIEESIHLAQAIERSSEAAVVLVDCLTLWLTNLLLKEDTELLENEISNFEAVVNSCKCHLILVSNETNMGIMPMDSLSRKFCDQAGLLHQRLAELCDQVELVVAGLPMPVKSKKNNET